MFKQPDQIKLSFETKAEAVQWLNTHYVKHSTKDEWWSDGIYYLNHGENVEEGGCDKEYAITVSW